MLTSLMNTLSRLCGKADNPAGQADAQHSQQQLLIWAQGCMLEGLPDEFYDARLECKKRLLAKGGAEVSVRHQFRLTAESDFERFSPADDLYPVQCVEQALENVNWSEATLIFSPEKASFSWH